MNTSSLSSSLYLPCSPEFFSATNINPAEKTLSLDSANPIRRWAFVPLRAPGSEGPGRGREAAAAEEDWHLGRGPDAWAMKRAGPVVTRGNRDR